MVKCDFCENEIKHPRGEKAIEAGWSVTEIKPYGKPKVVCISCQNPTCQKKMYQKMNELFHALKRKELK